MASQMYRIVIAVIAYFAVAHSISTFLHMEKSESNEDKRTLVVFDGSEIA